MGLETGSFVDDLVSTNPLGTDDKSVGDDHLRLIKKVLKATFIGATRPFHFPAAGAAKTDAYTILLTDENGLVRGNVSGGGFTITLPLGSSVFAGYEVTAMKSDSSANVLLVDGNGGETINGNANSSLSAQNASETYRWDGSEWKIVASSHETPIDPTDHTVTGEIKMWPTATPPSGYLELDGSEVSQTTYADLYAVLGADAFGTDAVGNFFLPDFRGRVPLGVGTGDASDATAHALADKEGTETHQLTVTELASHSHTYNTRTDTINHALGGSSANQGSGSIASGSTGGNSSHNNLQPSLAIHFIIKT